MEIPCMFVPGKNCPESCKWHNSIGENMEKSAKQQGVSTTRIINSFKDQAELATSLFAQASRIVDPTLGIESGCAHTKKV